MLKPRGLHAVCHHASKMQLHRYADEFTWGLNERNVKRRSLEGLDSFIAAITNRRITYKKLIA